MSSSPPLEAMQITPWRAPPPAARRVCIVAATIALLMTILLLVLPRPAAAQPIRGEATLSSRDGYARLVIRFPEAIDAQVRSSGGILIVQFARPVNVAVDRINVGSTDWI